jgi:hypothetical protein
VARRVPVPTGAGSPRRGAFDSRPGQPDYEAARQAIKDGGPLTVDVLYGDNEGGQRVISRFVLRRAGDDTYISSSIRHWNVDRPDPR